MPNVYLWTCSYALVNSLRPSRLTAFVSSCTRGWKGVFFIFWFRDSADPKQQASNKKIKLIFGLFYSRRTYKSTRIILKLLPALNIHISASRPDRNKLFSLTKSLGYVLFSMGNIILLRSIPVIFAQFVLEKRSS